MLPVRVCAYNVWGFRLGVEAAAAAVADLEPDIALVNEVGRGRDLRRFARRLGMRAVSGLRLFRKNPNAVLYRPPWRLLEERVHLLVRHTRLLPRGVVLARLGRSGHRVWAASVHLGLSDAERVEHARELTDLLAGLEGRVILGGDLNEDPDRPAAAWIAERMWDGFAHAGEGTGLTFPCADPRARIDYVFTGPGGTVHRCWVPDGDAVLAGSDHRPVAADLTLEV